MRGLMGMVLPVGESDSVGLIDTEYARNKGHEQNCGAESLITIIVSAIGGSLSRVTHNMDLQ